RGNLTPVLEHDRFTQYRDEAIGEVLERRVTGFQLAQHHELVSAEAPDGVLCADGAPQPLRYGSQELVPHRVSEVVVDVLETVDVDKERARDDAGLARGSREQLLGTIQHQRA